MHDDRRAIRILLGTWLAARRDRGVELTFVGDWAWLQNYLRVTVTPPGKEATPRSGYTLTILREGAEGKWKIARGANLLTAES